MEASRNRRIVLDERPSHCVPGKLFVDKCVVAQQSSVCSKGDTANVTSREKRGTKIQRGSSVSFHLSVGFMMSFVASFQLNTIQIRHQEASVLVVNNKKISSVYFLKLCSTNPGHQIFAGSTRCIYDQTSHLQKTAGTLRPLLQT